MAVIGNSSLHKCLAAESSAEKGTRDAVTQQVIKRRVRETPEIDIHYSNSEMIVDRSYLQCAAA